jgi:hypothetical protein
MCAHGRTTLLFPNKKGEQSYGFSTTHRRMRSQDCVASYCAITSGFVREGLV